MFGLISFNFKTEFNKSEGYQTFEKNFILSTALTGALISFFGLIINALLGFQIELILLPIAAFFIFLAFYYLGRYKQMIKTAKWGVVFFTLFAINYLWVENFGSRGPAPYFFVFLYSLLLFIWHGKEITRMTFVLFLNLIILFFIDYYYPGFTDQYDNEHARIIDVYTGLLMYALFIFVLMSAAKQNYLREYEKAKKSDMLKSAFLANMSHEIRTPMNAIVGFSGLLNDADITEEKRRHYIGIINDNSASLARLVEDIIDISKIESNQMTISPRSTIIGEMLEKQRITFLQALVTQQKPKIALRLTLPPHDFSISTDPNRIQQIVSNLLDNAVKFTFKGEIHFGCEIKENHILFFVEDTGIGIKKDNFPLIFERFTKIEENGELYKGTGIGLFLCKQLVELLNGTINIKSEVGVGSRFEFTLPKTDFTYIEYKTQEKKKKTSHDWRDKLILIVEDEAFNYEYLSETLAKTKVSIIWVKSGTDALDLIINNNDFDLILMDLKIPDMDGFEVVRLVRDRNINIPIIAQTAYAMAGDELKCLTEGFNDYLSKPIDDRLLIEKLNKYLQ